MKRSFIVSPNFALIVRVRTQFEFLSRLGVDIFQPLFEVTQDPTTHPDLHIFLQRVVGFDSVDDESKPERRLYRKFPLAKDWNTTQNRE